MKRVFLAFVLFMLNVASIFSVMIYILAWGVIVSIWIATSIVVVLLLLSVVFMGDKSKYKKDGTHYQDSALHHKKFKNILTDIWLWIDTSSLKFLHIMHGSTKTDCIKCTDDAANNHALHANNLEQGKEQVNHKQTEPIV